MDDMSGNMTYGAARAISNLPPGITAAAAVTIYQSKANKTHRTGSQLSQLFGVSAKAVRDVWNLRTWTLATMPYWSAEDREKYKRRENTGAIERAEDDKHSHWSHEQDSPSDGSSSSQSKAHGSKRKSSFEEAVERGGRGTVAQASAFKDPRRDKSEAMASLPQPFTMRGSLGEAKHRRLPLETSRVASLVQQSNPQSVEASAAGVFANAGTDFLERIALSQLKRCPEAHRSMSENCQRIDLGPIRNAWSDLVLLSYSPCFDIATCLEVLLVANHRLQLYHQKDMTLLNCPLDSIEVCPLAHDIASVMISHVDLDSSVCSPYLELARQHERGGTGGSANSEIDSSCSKVQGYGMDDMQARDSSPLRLYLKFWDVSSKNHFIRRWRILRSARRSS